MLGVVNLDKPVGPTSHDMVGLVRRLTGTRRIGHAGTLDPLASGVLPILVGLATRFSDDLTHGRKRYLATIRLGIRSESDDAEGPLHPVAAPLPDEAAIRETFASLVGNYDQVPPAFSARKLAGRRAYRAARAGAPLELTPRPVTVDTIELLELTRGDGWLDVRIDIRCGPGTYVRSIARDAGERLGCGGHLHALRRTEAAGLSVEAARTPGELESLAAEGRLAEAILPITDLLPLPRLELAAADADRFLHGSVVRIEAGTGGRHLVLRGGRLLGVGSVMAGMLQPEKVVGSGPSAGVES